MLARGQLGQRRCLALPAEHPPDHLRIEHGPPVRHAPDRARELLDVGDAVLEQVPDRARVLADQLERVVGLDVLRQHEHADVGMRLADLDRRAQSVVGVGRRHADVDDRDVRAMRADLAEELVGITGLRYHVEALGLEHADHATAQQDVIVGDHQAQRPAVTLGGDG